MRAFTLIEVLIYLGLFTLLLLGSISAMMSITMNSERNRNTAALEEEGEFIMQKVSWYIDTSEVTPTLTTSTLSTKNEGSAITIVHTGDSITVTHDSDAPEILLNPDVLVTSFSFHSGTTPSSITLTLALQEKGTALTETFTRTWYLHPYP